MYVKKVEMGETIENKSKNILLGVALLKENSYSLKKNNKCIYSSVKVETYKPNH